MRVIFENILAMSKVSCIVILIVLGVRFLFKKAPRRLTCLLWIIVALRLVLPVMPESKISIIPRAIAPATTSIAEVSATDEPQTAPAGLEVSEPAATVLSENHAPANPAPSATATVAAESTINPFVIIWAAGVVLMTLYGIFNSIRLRRLVEDGIRVQWGIYRCDRIQTPFIIGIIAPRICIPSSLDDCDYPNVIAHEESHISRMDHISKVIAFVILSVHWFNPLVWLSFILFERDIEFACDEKAISGMTPAGKKSYVNTLLSCATHKSFVFTYPLGFGDISVMERVKAVKDFRKARASVIVFFCAICTVVSGCLLTNPEAIVNASIAPVKSVVELVEVLPDINTAEDSVSSAFRAESARPAPPEDAYVFEDTVLESCCGKLTPLYYTFDGYRLFFTYDFHSEYVNTVSLTAIPRTLNSSHSTEMSIVEEYCDLVCLDYYAPSFRLLIDIGIGDRNDRFTIDINLTTDEAISFPVDIDATNLIGAEYRFTGIGISRSNVVAYTTPVDSSAIEDEFTMTLITGNGDEIYLVDRYMEPEHWSTFGPMLSDSYISSHSCYETLFDIPISDIAALVIENATTGESVEIDIQ